MHTEPDLQLKHGTSDDSNNRLGELITRLPNEVLSEIFGWCCPASDDRFRAPPMSALVLSHVCKRWRQLAFSTPRLWTYTSLGAPRHRCESATELMLLWISNSKTCPVVLDIDFSKFAAFKTPDSILPAVLELTELASESKRSSFPCGASLSVSVQPSVSISFPYICEEYYWTNEDEDLPESLAPNSIQIRVATKPCILLGMEGHRDFGPYLVHLDLRDEEEAISLTMDEALDIMKVYPNLRHLTFRLGCGGERAEVCTLPHLKTLAITWSEDADPASFLNSLSAAPCLQNLEIDGQIPGAFISGNVWNPLRQFLVRLTPPLRTLDLYKVRCDDVDLLACLGHCTTLERLWLEDCSVGESIIRGFTESRHPLADPVRTTLENLRTLGLVRCTVHNMRHYFDTVVASGLVWEISSLQGLYLSDCKIGEGIPETWHFLRSRYEEGAYKSLV